MNDEVMGLRIENILSVWRLFGGSAENHKIFSSPDCTTIRFWRVDGGERNELEIELREQTAGYRHAGPCGTYYGCNGVTDIECLVRITIFLTGNYEQ